MASQAVQKSKPGIDSEVAELIRQPRDQEKDMKCNWAVLDLCVGFAPAGVLKASHSAALARGAPRAPRRRGGHSVAWLERTAVKESDVADVAGSADIVWHPRKEQEEIQEQALREIVDLQKKCG